MKTTQQYLLTSEPKPPLVTQMDARGGSMKARTCMIAKDTK